MNKILSSIKSFTKDLQSEYLLTNVTKLLSKKRYSDIPKVLDTFDKYCNVQIQQQPLLIHLIQSNNLECLQTFLENINYKQQVYQNQCDDLATLPIFLVCMNNQQQILDIMLKNQAKIDVQNSLLQNILHLSAINISNSGIDIGLKNKVSSNVLDTYLNLPLHYAARCGNIQIVKKLLKSTSVKYTKNSFGQYPLHLAIQSQNLQITKIFLKDTKLQPKGASHAFNIASKFSNSQILQLLLNQNKQLTRQPDDNSMLPIHLAAIQGNLKAIDILMKHSDINVVDNMKHTPLHLAVLENKLETIKVLMKNGANPRLTNIDGLNCLDLAKHTKNHEIIKYLQIFGPKGLE